MDQISIIRHDRRFSSNVKFFLQSCFLESNEATVSGTKLDFLSIRKKASKNKHQTVASIGLLIFKCLNISHNIYGVIGWAWFGQGGFSLDKPSNTNLKWKDSNFGYSKSKYKCNNFIALI